MIHNPEFVRGNQKSYIRVSCDAEALKSYEYQMCSYNDLKSLLSFQQRSQNGLDYLYYEISGMQSLDVYLQTQKLKRPFAIALARAISKLCRELSEYALDIAGIIFSPRYIMISSNGEEIRFLYVFIHSGQSVESLEQLFECCIEYLDYQDEVLMEKLFGVYERLTDQKDNFLLDAEMDAFREALMEPVVVEIPEEVPVGESGIWTKSELNESIICEDKSDTKKFKLPKISPVAKKEYRNLQKGLGILLLLDVALLFFWKPLNLLKIFFVVAVGSVLLLLNVRVYKKARADKEELENQKQEHAYIEEYEVLAAQKIEENNYTQFIVVEDSDGVLYNLQECEPQYIYIDSNQKIIGKDAEKAQVHITREGVSRVHALVVKEGQECIIEDLNSTNGTWVNGKLLEPRTRYVLKQGDKVRFASLEYIFR